MQHVLSPKVALPAARIDIFAASIVLVFLFGWHWRVTGFLSSSAAASLAYFLALCLVYGSVFTRLIASVFLPLPGMPFQVLTGYFAFNTLLFILALCSPFGMMINLAILTVVGLLGLILAPGSANISQNSTSSDQIAGCIAILLSCIGATICCSDIQVPEFQNGNIIYKVWSDVFIHVREISVFAQAHGIGSVQDIKLAGGHAPIYHFASYLAPAAISVLSGASAMDVYASLQLPLGIMFTGLAAFCFMGKLFGYGPGIAATVAVVLIPDAFQQGFHVRYLSYNFMAQVNLGMLYGIAAIALAWMFMIDGCRRGKYGPVLLGYGFLVLCLFYKAHLFVANSYVLMMFPFVFFSQVRRSWRVWLGIASTVVFCLIISLSQSNPRVPTMRLDGSGIGPYMVLLLRVSDPSWVSITLRRLLIVEHHSYALQATYIAAFLLISTFGLWLAGVTLALGKTWRSMPRHVWFFPVIVIVNYIVTTMGLAMDAHMVGSAEELLNRPFVWAYFAVAAWTGAVGYRLLIGDGLPRGKGAVAAALVCLLAAVAALRSAPDLQTYPQYDVPDFATGAVPVCLIEAAHYLRDHSAVSDLIQDAGADTRFRLSAFSERQLYVGNEYFGGVSPIQEARLEEVKSVAQMGDASQIRQFFSQRHIDWYLQRPETHLAWPAAGLPTPVFTCGDFRLFHFGPSTPRLASTEPEKT